MCNFLIYLNEIIFFHKNLIIILEILYDYYLYQSISGANLFLKYLTHNLFLKLKNILVFYWGLRDKDFIVLKLNLVVLQYLIIPFLPFCYNLNWVILILFYVNFNQLYFQY